VLQSTHCIMLIVQVNPNQLLLKHQQHHPTAAVALKLQL
jgi:hypothetical protein